jgi:hypothetical protein
VDEDARSTTAPDGARVLWRYIVGWEMDSVGADGERDVRARID